MTSILRLPSVHSAVRTGRFIKTLWPSVLLELGTEPRGWRKATSTEVCTNRMKAENTRQHNLNIVFKNIFADKKGWSKYREVNPAPTRPPGDDIVTAS